MSGGQVVRSSSLKNPEAPACTSGPCGGGLCGLNQLAASSDNRGLSRIFLFSVQPGALQVFQAVFCHTAHIGIGIIEEWFDQGLCPGQSGQR